MNDLSGLDWNAKGSSHLPGAPSPAQPVLRPTPSPSQSGRSTPLSAQVSGAKSVSNQPSSKAANNDSFSTLLASQPSKVTAPLSLVEKQKQLQAQKASLASSGQDPYSQSDNQFWEGLGSGRGTPAPVDQHQSPQARTDVDAFLATFNSDPAVSTSLLLPSSAKGLGNTTLSHGGNRSSNNHADQNIATASALKANGVEQSDDNDDPFGLSHLNQTKPTQSNTFSSGEDDILGDLGKPVSEMSTKKQAQPEAVTGNPRDRALAELVDMGFSPDRAQYALNQTQSGEDVQAAVNVLLNQAHGANKTRSKAKDAPQRRRRSSATHRPVRPPPDATDIPPWLNGTTRSSSRPGAKGPSDDGKDFAQQASVIGSSVWKSANSLWKTGQKRMAKAVADFQQEGDSSQPRWMREGLPEPSSTEGTKSAVGEAQGTNEAAMLDAPRQQPTPRHRSHHTEDRSRSSPPTRPDSTPSSAVQHVSVPQPRPQSARAGPAPRSVQRINRQAIEDETAQAYVSPARRRKQQQPALESKSQAEARSKESLDIFSADPVPLPTRSYKSPSVHQSTLSVPSKPIAQPRSAPSVPSSTLETSHRYRKTGTEAFKLGDYIAAQSNYSSALKVLPPSHPITIILRCNRAITSLKSGDAKAAVADADAALQTIGPSGGEGESILLATGEEEKSMREFYGKALMRKAEALEYMERWPEAAKIWKDAVQAGVGGAVAIQGRNRCEKASSEGKQVNSSAMRSAPATKAKPTVKPRHRPSAMANFSGASGGDSEAVKRLRAAEAAAARATDEAFALNDAVEGRISAWKGGKADNLRALLASLDIILWADAGWKKVGMSDLVLPNKVKIIYMKAIAKVHPDKIPQTASTEQKMISATVFSTLNEAWDKFKKDNNL